MAKSLQTQGIGHIGLEASKQYSDLTRRTRGQGFACSKTRIQLHTEQLEKLNSLKPEPASTPIWEVERAFSAMMVNMPNPAARCRYVKELLASVLAATGIAEQCDPRSLFGIVKEIEVPRELTQLRMDNERLQHRLAIADATIRNDKDREALLQKRIDELEAKISADMDLQKIRDRAAFNDGARRAVELQHPPRGVVPDTAEARREAIVRKHAQFAEMERVMDSVIKPIVQEFETEAITADQEHDVERLYVAAYHLIARFMDDVVSKIKAFEMDKFEAEQLVPELVVNAVRQN